MASYNVIVPSSNYRFRGLPTGRGKYDIYVQGVFEPNFEGLLQFSLGDVSSKISGIVKLSQEYLIILLTSPGSDMFTPSRGTGLTDLIGGNFYNRDEVRIIVRDSVDSAARQVRDQQASYRPSTLEETFRSAELLSLNFVGNDEIHPNVLVTSEAGKHCTVDLPGINVF